MPDRSCPHRRPATGLRAALIELISRSAGAPDEAELRALVDAARDRATALRRSYDGGRHDPRGPIFAAHAD